jgi:hypothetical protein
VKAKPRPFIVDPVPNTGRGSISANEVTTLREFGRRLGLANKALCDAQKAGLKTCLVGRVKFVCGSDAVEWFRQQAEQQSGDQSTEAREDD